MIVLVALMLLVVACGQTAPERDPVPAPPAEEPAPLGPAANAVAATTASCVFVTGQGARVVAVEPGFDIGNLLAVGDIITGIDDTPITSQQTLIEVLQGRSPGEEIGVSYVSGVEARQGTTVLGSRPDEPQTAMLGVQIDTETADNTHQDLPRLDSSAAAGLLAVAENRLYRVDPLAGTWHSVGLPSPGRVVVAFDGELWAPDPALVPRLVRLTDGATIDVATNGHQLIQPLTTAGSLLIAEVATEVGVDPSFPVAEAVIASDLAAGNVVWEWDPGTVDGDVLRPVSAGHSPSGDLLTVTSLGDTHAVTTLIETGTGQLLAGHGTSIPFLPDQSVMGGWLDDRTVVWFGSVDDGFEVRLLDILTGESTPAVTISADSGLVQVWGVGDGRHIIIATQQTMQLFDVIRGAEGRSLVRNCAAFILGDPDL